VSVCNGSIVGLLQDGCGLCCVDVSVGYDDCLWPLQTKRAYGDCHYLRCESLVADEPFERHCTHPAQQRDCVLRSLGVTDLLGEFASRDARDKGVGAAEARTRRVRRCGDGATCTARYFRRHTPFLIRGTSTAVDVARRLTTIPVVDRTAALLMFRY